jgi:hypothetical protein
MTELEPENTNLNKSIVKICTLFSYTAPYNKHPDDDKGIAETCRCDK